MIISSLLFFFYEFGTREAVRRKKYLKKLRKGGSCLIPMTPWVPWTRGYGFKGKIL
jgi:hypothetical protein